MNVFLYIIIWIIGTMFGSFFTLSVYRIPKKENITHKRSYCPKCNHRLEFWDLIPVFSYIFLKGKCRYCKEPIHKRYILFEIFTGLIFVVLALSLNINVYSSKEILIKFIYEILLISIFMIVGLIDKEKNDINLTVILFGILFRTIYLFKIELDSFTKYFLPTAIVYILISIILVAIKSSKEEKKDKLYNILMYMVLLIYTLGVNISCILMVMGLLYCLIKKYVLKKDIMLLYFLTILAIITLILLNFSIIRNILLLGRGII